jgi:uncharacterized protein (UPF0210 family)
MNIRALTGFLDPGWPLDPRRIDGLAACLTALRAQLADSGYTVQSLRLATPPPSRMSRAVPPAQRPNLARQLEAECFAHGIDYAALGPALPNEPEGYAVVPDVLRAAENLFASGSFADPKGGLSISAAQACAQVITEAAVISPDGFANLRFAALANVPSGAPFFPAAYHEPEMLPAFAIAAEGAELAVDALHNVPSLAVARRRLTGMVEAHAAALTRSAQRVAAEHEVRFLGIDFSLAPFPEHTRSLGAALESFGLPAVGLAGTAAAAAFLTDCLEQAQFLRTGFCGLLLPPLEDDTLGRRAAEGSLTVKDLLLYSTVCGTGLDTIPLPGDTKPEAITAVLLDLGALALRLGKPLTARLLPIPGKAAGDKVHFDFAYFADSQVMSLSAQPLTGLLGGSGTLDLGLRLPRTVT